MRVTTPLSSPPLPRPGSHLRAETATQPDNWIDVGQVARDNADLLPAPGARVAILGCGTSLYVARAVAALRESTGQGETDAWPGGDPVGLGRDYDHVVAITRSGTTTEILESLAGLRNRTRVTVITADTSSPVVELGDVISLAHVDEQSVVQSRTATTCVAMWRWHLGHDLTEAAQQAAAVIAAPDAEYDALVGAEQATFLGMGWTFGLAEEASLKLKESTQSWTEAYHMTEYRHGPISIAAPQRLVWGLGPWAPHLARDVDATGATRVGGELDALAELVRVHRLCLLRAEALGLDPDVPRGLTRSIILDA